MLFCCIYSGTFAYNPLHKRVTQTCAPQAEVGIMCVAETLLPSLMAQQLHDMIFQRVQSIPNWPIMHNCNCVTYYLTCSMMLVGKARSRSNIDWEPLRARLVFRQP